MGKKKTIERGRELAGELAQILRELSDAEVGELLHGGTLDGLVRAILDPADVKNYPTYADFFLANKMRAAFIAAIRRAITQNYAYRGKSKLGATAYVSPLDVQFFEDGVMLLEGKDPFSGLVALYRDGRLTYAVAARDMRPRQQMMTPESLEFMDIEDARKLQRKIPLTEIDSLDEPIQSLKKLLDSQIKDSAKYRELFERYPWVLGARYAAIQDLAGQGEKRMPRLTGVRVHDGERDILEVGSPFMKIVSSKNELSSEFNRAWNRSEALLRFVREEKEYLQRLGFRFGDPACYLVVGYGLTEEQRDLVRTKTRMNPSIQVLTYNDLLVWMSSTTELVRTLAKEGKISSETALSEPRSSSGPLGPVNIMIVGSIAGSQVQQGTEASTQILTASGDDRPRAEEAAIFPAELTNELKADYKRFEYRSHDRIRIPGTAPVGKTNRMVVNGSEVPIRESSFLLLLRLVAQLHTGKEGWVSVQDLQGEGFPVSSTDQRAWLRLRKDLRGFLLDSDPKKLIENNKSGSYRVSTHPDFVTYDKEKLLLHPNQRVKDLAKMLP